MHMKSCELKRFRRPSLSLSCHSSVSCPTPLLGVNVRILSTPSESLSFIVNWKYISGKDSSVLLFYLIHFLRLAILFGICGVAKLTKSREELWRILNSGWIFYGKEALVHSSLDLLLFYFVESVAYLGLLPWKWLRCPTLQWTCTQSDKERPSEFSNLNDVLETKHAPWKELVLVLLSLLTLISMCVDVIAFLWFSWCSQFFFSNYKLPVNLETWKRNLKNTFKVVYGTVEYFVHIFKITILINDFLPILYKVPVTSQYLS